MPLDPEPTAAAPMHPRLLVASVFTRRRVMVGCFLIPGLCILLPLLLVALSTVLSLISGGLPWTAFGIFLICIYQLQPLIPGALKQVVADDYLYAEKLAQSKTRLPIYSVVVAGMVCRLILNPLSRFIFGDAVSWQQNGGGPSGMLLGMGVTMAFSTAVLSLPIVFRYLGPMSIMRSSSIPLKPTPFVAAVSSLKHQVSSPADFLRVLTRPDPNISKIPSHHNNIDETRIYYRHGRPQHSASSPLGGRYLMPPLPLLLAQVVCHAVFGATFASVVQTQLLPAIADGATANGGLLFACLASSVLTFVFTIALDGKSHELQIEHRSDFIAQTPSPGDAVWAVFVRSMSKVQGGGSTLLALVVFLPSVVTIALSLAEAGEETSSTTSRMITGFVLAFSSACASLFVCVYLVVVDETTRRTVATSGLDVDRLLNLMPGTMLVDGPFIAEDLFIQSLIYGCDGGDELRCRNIINDLAKERLGAAGGAYSVSHTVAFNFEEEEVRRNDAAIDAVAEAMITPRSVPAAKGRALEEDVLRVALLETLGGTDGSYGCNFDGSEVEEQAIPSRYYVALRKRLLVSEETLAKKSQYVQQPRVVPLIRALLAASGGLGEALLFIYKGGRTFGDDGFMLPPGATTTAEYSLLAAARLIALNLKLGTNGDRGYLHWVSLLSPAFFHSAYRLRFGVLEYAKHQRQLAGGTAATNSDFGTFIAVNCPDLRRLLDACDNGAKLILTALEEHERGRNVEVLVHSDCRAWLADLK